MKDITRKVIRSDASDPENRMRKVSQVVTVGLIAAIIGAVLTFAITNHYKTTKETAVSNSINQAEAATQSDICKTFPDEPLCRLAEEILADPTDPVTGSGVAASTIQKGEDGRGVTSFRTDGDGHLIVTYTDGNSADLGRVLGKDGEPGKSGKDGEPGKDGEDGDAGRSILASTIDAGALIITYSDGEVSNAGNIVGPAGEPGKDGINGIDGKNGIDGANGISVENVTVDENNTVFVTYSDGRTEPAGTVTVNPTTIELFQCVDGILTLTLSPYSTASTNVDCSPDEATPAPEPQPEPAPEEQQPAPVATLP